MTKSFVFMVEYRPVGLECQLAWKASFSRDLFRDRTPSFSSSEKALNFQPSGEGWRRAAS
jgi:hypothetical protein